MKYDVSKIETVGMSALSEIAKKHEQILQLQQDIDDIIEREGMQDFFPTKQPVAPTTKASKASTSTKSGSTSTKEPAEIWKPKVLAVLEKHPDGTDVATVAAETGTQEQNARVRLGKLVKETAVETFKQDGSKKTFYRLPKA